LLYENLNNNAENVPNWWRFNIRAPDNIRIKCHFIVVNNRTFGKRKSSSAARESNIRFSLRTKSTTEVEGDYAGSQAQNGEQVTPKKKGIFSIFKRKSKSPEPEKASELIQE